MITKSFDNGFDNSYEIKKFEIQITNQILRDAVKDENRNVIINSVWYTQSFHETVMTWLRSNNFDRIILVAMIDPAIPQPQQYQEFNKPVSAVGYYPGECHVDFWALFVDRFMQIPKIDELMREENIDTPFMSLNRKPHPHRIKFYQQLTDLGIENKGFVSMGKESGPAIRKLKQDGSHDEFAPNASNDHYGLPNDIASLGHPINWQKHFLNIVTETTENIYSTYFVSEKIYKPIIGCRPFLVYDSDGGTTWMEEKGFESYVCEFADISDADLRVPGNIAIFLDELCKQPKSYYKKKYQDLREKILYNNNHFRSYIRQQNSILERGIVL